MVASNLQYIDEIKDHFRLDDIDHPKEHDTNVDGETSFITPGVDTALTAVADAAVTAVTDVTPNIFA